MNKRSDLKKARRIVVKVGTSLVTNGRDGVDCDFVGKLAREVSWLTQDGREVIIVSSGAIGVGMAVKQLAQRPKTIPGKQAMAAIGQPRLMQTYEHCFARHRLITAQVLLTAEDIRHRERYFHARNALRELLRLRVIPIFNENDTVAVQEIKIGDNDTLSAHVTHLADAVLLVILSNIAGLYTGNPTTDPKAKLLEQVDKIDRAIEAMASGAGHRLGTGGMATKIKAAKMVTGAGETMVIADGRIPNVLIKILEGKKIGTIFYPRGDKLTDRKRWIAYSLRRRGALYLDAGASLALKTKGRSLLSAGIRAVEGQFKQGDCLSLMDEHGEEFARGLVNYTAAEVALLRGASSREIERILGYKTSDEIVHREDMVLLK